MRERSGSALSYASQPGTSTLLDIVIALYFQANISLLLANSHTR